MTLRSLFYFVLLAAVILVGLSRPSASLVIASSAIALVSYCKAFIDFAAGQLATRLQKGAFLFGGIAYACFLGNVETLYGPSLDYTFIDLFHYLHSAGLEIEADSREIGVHYLPNFDFVQAKRTRHFVSLCNLTTSVIVSIVCYWSMFAHRRLAGNPA